MGGWAGGQTDRQTVFATCPIRVLICFYILVLSGILGSDGKQNTAPVLGSVIFVALSISSHEQTQ